MGWFMGINNTFKYNILSACNFFKYKNKINEEYRLLFITTFSSIFAYFIWGMTANAWIPVGFLLFFY